VALARLDAEFAACWTSPKIRARDTARLACEALGVEPQDSAALADGFDRDDAFELLQGYDDDARVLAVGHEPSFSQVVHDLTGARIHFSKGGIAAVRMRRTSPELFLLLRPREVEAIAGARR
jgi:phosphohistidine phosphatase